MAGLTVVIVETHDVSTLEHLVRAAAWGLVAVVVLATLAQPGGPLAPRAFAGEALVVTGAVDGLEPGRTGSLTLTVANPSTRPVVVRRLQARVVGSGSPLCGPDKLTVTPWAGELAVPEGGTGSADLALVVADDGACAGVTWQLSYSAAGRAVARPAAGGRVRRRPQQPLPWCSESCYASALAGRAALGR